MARTECRVLSEDKSNLDKCGNVMSDEETVQQYS